MRKYWVKMVGKREIILLSLFLQFRIIKSDQSFPSIRVKFGAIVRGVNISAFDVSENEIVVDRGNTVQFICDGDDDLEWEYGEDTSKLDR